MVRAIKRQILKGRARRQGVTKVNRRFSWIWAQYQRGEYKEQYERITRRGKKIHGHSIGPATYDRQAARKANLGSIARQAVQNLKAAIGRKTETRKREAIA